VGRFPLAGLADPALPVRRLTDVDLTAEKLLANADRGLDDAALGRDRIDLILLEEAIGRLPPEAFEKARSAYGAAIDRAYEDARDWLGRDPQRLARFLDVLDASASARALVERVLLHRSREEA
jgi:hypothetical protein